MSSEDARGAVGGPKSHAGVGGPKSPRWTADEDQRLSELVRAAPDRARPGMWDRIALSFPDRTASAVEHRWKDLNRDSEDARLTVGSDDAASDARSAVADDAPPGPARRALRSDDATTRPFYGGGGRYCICAGAGRGEMVACDGGCSNSACVLGPDSLASHAWAENRPSLRRGQQVVCPVCRTTSWIPPGFL